VRVEWVPYKVRPFSSDVMIVESPEAVNKAPQACIADHVELEGRGAQQQVHQDQHNVEAVLQQTAAMQASAN
jgi:hypothetical protein